MKHHHLQIYTARLVLALIFCQSIITTVSADTAAVINDTVASTPAKQPMPTEIVDCSLHAKALVHLQKQGIILPGGQVAAIWFEPDPADAQKKWIVLITIGGDNQPLKHAFAVDRSFYDDFSGLKVEKGVKKEPASPMAISTQADTIPVTTPNPQDGRLYFILNTTARSLYVYPAGFGATMGDNVDGRVIAGLSLLSLGGSLYGSYVFSKNIELGYGTVEFMNFGADMGGITYPNLAQALYNAATDADENENYHPLLSSYSAMIGFPLGIYLGSKMRFAGRYEYGNASIMTNMARISPLYGFLLPALFTDNIDANSFTVTATSLSMLLIPTGFYTGYRLVGDKSFSSGKSIIISASGILGALSGLVTPILFDEDADENHRAYVLAILSGHLAGTWFGFNYKANETYTYGQGIFTSVSAGIGAGIGLAFPLIMKNDNFKSYIIMGMAGAWSGLLAGERLSKSLFEKDSHDSRQHVQISFPGLTTLPALLLSQRCTAFNDDHSSVHGKELLPQVPLFVMRF